MSVALVLSILNLVVLTVSALTAYVTVKKLRDSRAIDFILQAESAIDGLRQELTGRDPSLIRNIYQSYPIDRLSDEDVQAFPFMHGIYVHVSRMYFILSAKSLDHGLKEFEHQETIRSWMDYLLLFKDHPAMIAMHYQAMRDRDRNSAFLAAAEELLGDLSAVSQRLDGDEV